MAHRLRTVLPDLARTRLGAVALGRGAVPITLALAVGACASNPSPSARGTEIDVRYATVARVSREALPSAAPAGAVVGGFTGLALTRRGPAARQVAGGVGGAALGALAARALEGERLGYAYELRFRNGDESRFITEKGFLREGDCVAVERGAYANVRRVDAARCASQAPVVAADQRDARLCHDAKDQLLAASGSEAVDEASRKVELLCRFEG